ncbi:VanZ like family protein [Idiomarina sp. A28L]|uniref:VanZ family protein n=1 Tax=Idiomarina sp. A28L TaxID=1036674 RepID=UPI00021385B7|nr:VanZ family protein [Idiomarina sp. A28L]EGN75203.1 VanZ like family protein [Idiomarina sp. A28L]
MFWRILFIIVVVVVSALFLMQTPPSPSVANFAHADKVVHFGLFFVLAITMHLAFRPRLWLALPILLIYAVTIEIVQHYVPGRGADIWDVIADMVGVLGFYLARAVYKKSKKRSL